MEAFGLGIFMLSACVFDALLEHPSSPLHLMLDDAFLRRALMGVVMGLTAIAIFYSPWGKRSGAHINPAVTLAFYTLGKIRSVDATGYVIAQFAGSAAGVGVAALLIGPPLAHSSVNFVVTVPMPGGELTAFLAEALISFLMVTTVLLVSNTKEISHYTPLFAGSLVALFITFEAPLSGMSMNPARTFASAVFANDWRGGWIYFTAPFLGMTAAAQLYRFHSGLHRVFCAKLHPHHHHSAVCIFHCNYGELHGNQ